MIKSKLLLAVHRSADFFLLEIGALSIGVWPLAMSDRVVSGAPQSYEDLDGFWTLWEAVATPEDFGMCAFGGGDLDGPVRDAGGWGGLWVYEVIWDESEVRPECDDCSDPDAWAHLQRGGSAGQP